MWYFYAHRGFYSWAFGEKKPDSFAGQTPIVLFFVLFPAAIAYLFAQGANTVLGFEETRVSIYLAACIPVTFVYFTVAAIVAYSDERRAKKEGEI